MSRNLFLRVPISEQVVAVGSWKLSRGPAVTPVVQAPPINRQGWAATPRYSSGSLSQTCVPFSEQATFVITSVRVRWAKITCTQMPDNFKCPNCGSGRTKPLSMAVSTGTRRRSTVGLSRRSIWGSQSTYKSDFVSSLPTRPSNISPDFFECMWLTVRVVRHVEQQRCGRVRRAGCAGRRNIRVRWLWCEKIT